jgi:hypothetical protein
VLSVVASARGAETLPATKAAKTKATTTKAATAKPDSASAPEATPPAIEVLSLLDPEATVVRRRTELLGQPELPQRATEEVTSAEALVAALSR